MHTLVQRVKKNIIERGLLRPRQRVLVAVSGGVDSMVLLHVLLDLANEFKWHLTVAHFNHKLRGRDANADEKLVQHTAARLGLKCVCGEANVRRFAKQNKLSIELAARTLRHKFLAETARQLRIRTIALGHHANDQVELFFVRLLRGTSSAGLAGMRWRSPSPADPRVDLVRPLLDVPKSFLLEFANIHNVPFRQDTTNYSTDYLRNRIRNLLLPWLANQFGTGFTKTIPRLMEIAGAEADFVNTVAKRWLRAKRKVPFDKLPIAVQRQVIVLQLLEHGVNPEFDMVEQLRIQGDKPITIGPSLKISCDRAGKVQKLAAQNTASSLPEFNNEKVQINFNSRAGDAVFGGLKLTWRIVQCRKHTNRQPAQNCELFDADKVGPGAILRHWQAGDKFQPIGMSKPVKLQDIFTNLKIPKQLRHKLIVAQTLAGEIFWVEGVRISEQFKLDNQTKRLLKWTWQRL